MIEMPDRDKYGRPYAFMDDLIDGRTVWLDGGFTCHPPGPVQVVGRRTPHFVCSEGEHAFDGQCDGRGGSIQGVYLDDPGPLEWQHAQ